jgi:CheY-like chemotaxis protein
MQRGRQLGEVEEQSAQVRVSANNHSLHGLMILVVDDDFRNLFAMTALLERLDAKVVVAESGQDAIITLDVEPIDLVLMDIMMPSMDGYDTIRAIGRWIDSSPSPSLPSRER